MPDLSGNVTMARKGLANMAITACYRVKLTPAIRTGFVFCSVNCGLLLVSGPAIKKGIIASGHGYTTLFLYAAYIGTALLLQFLM